MAKWRCTISTLLVLGLLLGCGSPTVEPDASPTNPPATERPEETLAPRPEATSTTDERYAILDVGQDETWDGRPLAYLSTALCSLDPEDGGFEQQLRWAYRTLYERYPNASVLEVQYLHGMDYAFFFDASVGSWLELQAGELDWPQFWAQVDRLGLEMGSGELYEGGQVESILRELQGTPVAGPNPASSGLFPTAKRPSPLPTAGLLPPVEATVTSGLPLKPARTPTTAPSAALDGRYEDPEGFFSLQYPAHWTPHRSGSEMQFWADAQGDAAVAVSLQIKALSPQALLQRFSDLFAAQWDGYQEVEEGQLLLGDFPAVWVEQSFRWSGQPYNGLMVATVRNRVGYLLLAWAPPEDYAELSASFWAVAQSLRPAEFAEAPLYQEWPTYSSEHFTFHYLPETYVADDIQDIAGDHERTFDDILRFLQVDYEGPIDFFLYPSYDSLYRATARDSGFAINEGHEVHSLWQSAGSHQSLGHEMTHVITSWTLGEPSEALLGEGIAVCLDHSGNDHHATSAELLEQGQLVPLDQSLGDDWFAHDPAVMYPQSGSFTCFLLENYGVNSFKQVYTQADLPQALKDVYGLDLDDLETAWHGRLRNGQANHTIPELDQLLCCGSSASGEYIWSVYYPDGWQVTYLPDNPRDFTGALISNPAGTISIGILPSTMTPVGTALDSGEVDEFLDAYLDLREAENPGFEEFMREVIDPGWPEARVWAGAWGRGEQRSWATYLVSVNAIEYWTPGVPRGYLTMLGLEASSSEWEQGLALYREILGSFRARRVSDNEPVGADDSMASLGELALLGFDVRWCPCTQEYVAQSKEGPSRTWPDCPCETRP
ncbi:MAG: hypothetical protein JXA37_13880 [Chloroflexia bacterium]|nr:hypothetical protein [Chloroflexia bacterium]